MRARCPQGYTLVELLVVLAVLGLLASMAMPLSQVTVQREKERELKRALWEIRDAIDAYRAVRSVGAAGDAPGASLYPPSLLALTRPVIDARPGREGAVHRFLRRVPRDPFADPVLPAERTWGLRSYLSEADRPQEGADVYDVYSLTDGKALNGTALRDW